MRHRHRWVAVAGAAVLTTAAFAAPALAAPAAPAGASVASAAVAGKSGPSHRGKAPVVRKGRYVARDNRHDNHGNDHGNSHDNGHDNGHGNTGNGHEGHNGDGNGHHDNGHHPYPCNGTPSLSIGVPSHVHSGRQITVTAKAVVNGVDVRDAEVGFYGSIDGGRTWKLYTTGYTDAHGSVDFSYTPSHDVLLRVVVVAKDGLGAAQAQQTLDLRH